MFDDNKLVLPLGGLLLHLLLLLLRATVHVTHDSPRSIPENCRFIYFQNHTRTSNSASQTTQH